jgi:hypothetical protein
VMECVIETKASMILQFIDGLRGDVHVTFEEGTWAASHSFAKHRGVGYLSRLLLGRDRPHPSSFRDSK